MWGKMNTLYIIYIKLLLINIPKTAKQVDNQLST